jgi:uncharacterized membrane protein
MEKQTFETLANRKPTVSDSYGHGWEVLKKSFLTLLLITIVVGVSQIPLSIFKEHHQISVITLNFLNVFGIIYFLFVAGPISYGVSLMFLKAVRGDEFEVKEMFDGFKNYLNVILANLLTSSIVIFGFLFLIVPGIVFACRLAFVPYLVMDKKLDPIKAVEESWKMTKGYGWKIFWMAMLAIPIGIAGLLALGFGIIVSIIWIQAAFAAMYYFVNRATKKEIIPMEV